MSPINKIKVLTEQYEDLPNTIELTLFILFTKAYIAEVKEELAQLQEQVNERRD